MDDQNKTQLKELVERLKLLHDISKKIMESKPLDVLLDEIIEHSIDVMQAEAASGGADTEGGEGDQYYDTEGENGDEYYENGNTDTEGGNGDEYYETYSDTKDGATEDGYNDGF